MGLLRVATEKCTKCGACAEVCPAFVIGMGEDGPRQLHPGCFACGHCVAVCPTAALDNRRAPLAEQAALGAFPVIDPDTAERFLRSRRAIRTYLDKPVPREMIVRLLNVARHAPTGANTQGVGFLVVQQQEMLRAVIETTVGFLEEQGKTPAGKFYGDYARLYRSTGKDIILRGAPCLVVTHGAAGNPMLAESTYDFIAYAELFATTLGLGTCWAGFVGMAAAANWQPLLDVLALPAGRAATGGFMLGYPRYRYHRLVARQPLQADWR